MNVFEKRTHSCDNGDGKEERFGECPGIVPVFCSVIAIVIAVLDHEAFQGVQVFVDLRKINYIPLQHITDWL